MDEPLEVGSTFPAPPNLYKRYTSHNLALLDKLNTLGPEALEGEELPDFDLRELEPPRVDWIVEEGGYQSFGDVYPIPSREPTLEEVGLVQLYDPNARDRRPALHSLLRTILHSYHTLLATLLHGPALDLPTLEDGPVFKYTEWIMASALNMMHAVNGLRGLQGRAVLEGVMRAQVGERRRRVGEVRGKCKALREELARLKERAARLTESRQRLARAELAPTLETGQPTGKEEAATVDDVARWVEEV